MLFQVVQDHLFVDDALKLFEYSNELTHTWEYPEVIGNKKIECAQIWAEGKSIDDCCPLALQPEWIKNRDRIKAFFKSFKQVGIKIKDFKILDFVPERFVKKYLRNKNQISEHVFGSCEKPSNYDFMFDLHRMIADIKFHELRFDMDFLSSVSTATHMKNILENLDENGPYVAFNPYGTITGRLGVQPGSFPILNVSREARGSILPNNDCFVELDFNAAELRVLLALNNREQPDVDIHEWNAKHIFKKDLDRDEIKRKTFAWLYNSKAVDKTLETCYNKNYVKEKYFDGSHVNTIFNRKIKSDDHHALNYIVQSTTSDLFLRQAIKIWELLKGRKSNVVFTIHDSLVIDFHLSDKEIIKGLIEEFSNTELGKFKVNISGGKNFGNMKKMDL